MRRAENVTADVSARSSLAGGSGGSNRGVSHACSVNPGAPPQTIVFGGSGRRQRLIPAPPSSRC